MKILRAEQIRQLDAYTIAHEPIDSLDLMERASSAFVRWFVQRFPDTGRPVVIFAGVGNNGGDGLAVARLLNQAFYEVDVCWCRISERCSLDFEANRARLPLRSGIAWKEIGEGDPFPEIPGRAIVMDAIFGSGLNRPVQGYWASLFEYLNTLPNCRVAIDVPSGLFTDQAGSGAVIHAHYTFTFEMPKLSFFFPESQQALGEWSIGPIGLDKSFIEQAESPYFYLTASLAAPLRRRRRRFDHKGSFGHALLIAGSRGSVGAAVLAARACLRSGVGLLTVHAPSSANPILQISAPEAMVSSDRHQFQLSEIPDLSRYAAVGIGCGLGQKETTIQALLDLLKKAEQPLVMDADALNILAHQPGAIDLIPRGSILTPHPKEFERLFGSSSDSFAQLDLLRRQSRERGLYILLKRAYTCIACPDGNCYFNSSGNPGMATGGSGDVLTGLLTGLLAQGYPAKEACLLGVYLHGLAGDLAAEELGQEALLAGDLVRYLGKAFQALGYPERF